MRSNYQILTTLPASTAAAALTPQELQHIRTYCTTAKCIIFAPHSPHQEISGTLFCWISDPCRYPLYVLVFLLAIVCCHIGVLQHTEEVENHGGRVSFVLTPISVFLAPNNWNFCASSLMCRYIQRLSDFTLWSTKTRMSTEGNGVQKESGTDLGWYSDW